MDRTQPNITTPLDGSQRIRLTPPPHTSRGRTRFGPAGAVDGPGPSRPASIPERRSSSGRARPPSSGQQRVAAGPDAVRWFSGRDWPVPAGPQAFGITDRSQVDLVSTWHDGTERRARQFPVVPYPTPPGLAAVNYPETNRLVPLDSVRRPQQHTYLEGRSRAAGLTSMTRRAPWMPGWVERPEPGSAVGIE